MSNQNDSTQRAAAVIGNARDQGGQPITYTFCPETILGIAEALADAGLLADSASPVRHDEHTTAVIDRALIERRAEVVSAMLTLGLAKGDKAAQADVENEAVRQRMIAVDEYVKALGITIHEAADAAVDRLAAAETEPQVGVVCGLCGGPVYMETCDMKNGTGHEWVIASECQRCGTRHMVESGCPACALPAVDTPTTDEPENQ